MRKFILSLFCVLLCMTALPASASGAVQDILDGITAHRMQASGASTVQEWIDGELSENAGITSEWYILALSQSTENLDFSGYSDSLHRYLCENSVSSASTRQKYALVQLAISENDDISELLRETIGKQGLMSYVFGLHLLHNTQGDFGISEEEIIAEILALQLSDGGFANAGDRADADVTAMTLQALAPHYPRYSAEIDRIITCLSDLQREDGGYQSYGVPNPESAAQVILALSALGIDGLTDERFVKNGNTLLDGIMPYRLPNGAFSHVLGGAENSNATTQVYLALTAYQMHKNGEGSLFSLRQKPKSAAKSPLGIRPVLMLTVGAVGAVVCIIMLCKKAGGKRILTVLCITAAGVLLIFFTDIRSPQEYYSAKAPANSIGTVTLSIRCDTVKERENMPKNGEILKETEVPIESGDTVFQVLQRATRTAQIPMEFSGSEKMPYIEGISDLYEFDCGELSGWVFHVNGEASSVGCGEYPVQDGDSIEWLYSLDLGNDVK